MLLLYIAKVFLHLGCGTLKIFMNLRGGFFLRKTSFSTTEKHILILENEICIFQRKNIWKRKVIILLNINWKRKETDWMQLQHKEQRSCQQLTDWVLEAITVWNPKHKTYQQQLTSYCWDTARKTVILNILWLATKFYYLIQQINKTSQYSTVSHCFMLVCWLAMEEP